MDNFGLSERTIIELHKFFKAFKEIEMVKIFGSRAKGTFKHNSDIDFAIYGNSIDEKLIRRISTEIDELPTPYKFDILNYKTIDNNNLKQIIDETGKIFYIL